METMLSNFYLGSLLTHVTLIRGKYDNAALLLGENFNVFRLLKVDTNEVRVHSAFIAELLNPQGSHNHGDRFLKLFIDQNRIQDFDTENSQVEVEKYIGQVTEFRGGRIDILVSSGNGKRILIENKIHAGDQQNQLVRYHNYDNTADIFYLTLFGDLPSEWSANSKIYNFKDNEIKLLSYFNDIVAWLEACRKESVTHSILRETISQYINLVKYLTNQTTNQIMSKEIKDLLVQNLDNFKSANECKNAFNTLYDEILNQTYDDLNTAYSLHFLSREKIEYEGYIIVLHIAQDGDGIYIGFTATKDGIGAVCKREEMLTLFDLLQSVAPGYRNTHHYIGWKYPENVKRKYLEIETVYSLNNNEFRMKFISDIISEGQKDWELFRKHIELLVVGSKF